MTPDSAPGRRRKARRRVAKRRPLREGKLIRIPPRAWPPRPDRMVKPENVVKRFWAYATLGRVPDEDKWEKLDADIKATALDMRADQIGTCLWALGTIRRVPTQGAWNVLEIAAEDTAPEMSAKSISNAVWAYARLKPVGLAKVDPDCWEALEEGIQRHAEAFPKEDAVNILWAFATLPRVRPAIKAPEEWLEGKMAEEEPSPEDETPDGEGEEAEEDAPPPPDDTFIALESAVARYLPRDMTPVEVATALWSFAKMGQQPEEATWEAFEAACRRVAPMIKGSVTLARMAWASVTLGWCPKHDDTRWLMHNAVLLRPTGLVQVGMTRTFAKTRAEGKMRVGEECSGHITAEQWLAWAMHQLPPVPPAKHALTFDPNAVPADGEGEGEGGDGAEPEAPA